jgi:hypothetical protein
LPVKKLREDLADAESRLATGRNHIHGQFANAIPSHRAIIKCEMLSYKSFQKDFGSIVKVRGSGMFLNFFFARLKAPAANLSI